MSRHPLLTFLYWALLMTCGSDALAQSSTGSLVLRPETRAQADAVGSFGVAPRPQERVSNTALAFGGVKGGALGALALGVVGHVALDSGDSWFPLGALGGGIAGWTLGVPLGVHVANERRGNYLVNAMAAAAILMAAVYLLVKVDVIHDTRLGSAAWGTGVVVAQFSMSIGIERGTAAGHSTSRR